ncbi:MAG: SIMPL domain-containing protein [Bacillota bacterium]
MDKRTIRVRGSAKVSGAPDWVAISFKLISQDYEYANSMEQLAVQTDSLRQELASVGLDKESLKTFQFNIETDFEWVKERYIFKGYKATHNLRIEFPFEKDYLNKVLRVLSRTKSQASFKISFEVKDPELLRQQAIAGAVKNSRENAKVLAEASGVTLGEIIEIDYSWSEIHFQPIVNYSCLEAASPPAYDITPEDVDVSDSVTVIWSIK